MIIISMFETLYGGLQQEWAEADNNYMIITGYYNSNQIIQDYGSIVVVQATKPGQYC